MIKRLKLEKSNLTPNFIGSWEMKAIICDHIINYYDKHQDKQRQGVTGNRGIILEAKDRKDISYRFFFGVFNCFRFFIKFSRKS